jgi:hypothetical protein
MVSSGGGDPPCVCSGFVSSCATGGFPAPPFRGGLRLVGAGRRFAAGGAFALVRCFPVVRGFEVARRFAVFLCFEVVRRFSGFGLFRDEREVAARFLRFAIVGSCWGKYSSKENLPAKRGLRAARLTCHYDRGAVRAASNSTFFQRSMSWNSLIPKASNHEGFAVT